MTGFGRADSSANGVNLDISVKSVNGRYLDVRAHLPKKYIFLEAEIQKIAKKHFSRGTLDIYVQRTNKSMQGSAGIRFNVAAAAEWVQEFLKVLKHLKMESTITARDLLAHVPNFMTMNEEETALPEKEKKQFLKTLEDAIDNCATARKKEGQFLKKVGLEYIQDLAKFREQLLKLRETFVAEAPLKMQERIEKILSKADLDPQRVAQEVAHLIERSDIEEELQRFGEHIKNVTALLKEAAQGKKLDFYAQELLREINTIGSKSQSAKITEIVVGTKNTIEQLREQIQNIE